MLTIYIYLIVLEPLKQRFYKKNITVKIIKGYPTGVET